MMIENYIDMKVINRILHNGIIKEEVIKEKEVQYRKEYKVLKK